ncbi:hypothetical protein Poli38472_001440 [Pythium oligandrum]|uniref:Uncharacterized protein n=1 Tax=Pythium oligandrum TaxID=41045 RepID=A0A8K1FQC6_PYTOL|nr:hypothetical protein Poli38472_001440 [Pythium oligandrum]|eukprot:TMW69284.1 hypothetical protein Poli38472_001440 [Pythium oligandrum]
MLHAVERRRKLTVNERIERILHGGLLDMEDAADSPVLSEADAQRRRRGRELATLYSSSTEDKFLKTRVRAAKSVPKHVHLGAPRGLTEIPPMRKMSSEEEESEDRRPSKPVKCYAKIMLQQQNEQDEEERKRTEAKQFPAPDFPPPKPWYKGYSPHHKAPSCSVDAKVRRYGAFGTIKMLASETTAGTAPPFKLHVSQSLDAIAYKDAPDAWSPGLHGSPSTWPEDSTHPQGSKLVADKMIRCPSPEHRFPTHCVGRMSPKPEDKHYERMQEIHTHDARALEEALDEEKARRRREIEYNKQKLAHWHASLQFEPLSNKIDHPFVKVHAQRAKEWTILDHPEHSSTSVYNSHVAKLTEQRFTLRWQSITALLDVMKRTPCRRPVLQDIEKLYGLAHELSLKNLTPLLLNRQQFWELMQKEYPLLDLTTANRLYSSYDCQMDDKLDIRVLLATIRALRVQQGAPIDVLCMALRDFDRQKRDVVSEKESLHGVLGFCCASDDEEREMRQLSETLWSRLHQQYTEARERRRVRRLQGREETEDDKELNDDAEDDEESETYRSSIPSLLMLGSENEGQGNPLPIRFIRKVLLREKLALQRFTDLLMKRREECFATLTPPPRAKSRGCSSSTGRDRLI